MNNTKEQDDDISYIEPNIETKLTKEKRQACRDIVQEIKKFGINQRQFLYLIYLLSLELENIENMKLLTSTIKQCREKLGESELILPNEQ